ncbi:MAG: exopolysaccharide biosynthesis protein [Gemmatimonadota bacterium]
MAIEPPQGDLSSLSGLLERMETVLGEEDPVSVETVLRVVGQRSFGPLLLLAGLITVAPLVGDIPGVPTLVGAFVVLMAGQLLMGRRYFWLPDWLLQRTLSARRLRKALEWARSPARIVDNVLQPRLRFLVGKQGSYAIALVCGLLGVGMPVLEFVPFSATVAGAVLTLFGLALVGRDGLLAALGFLVSAGTLALAVMGLSEERVRLGLRTTCRPQSSTR